MIKFFRKIREKKQCKSKTNYSKLFTKNKWLYTTDNFGKLEKGVVYYSETL